MSSGGAVVLSPVKVFISWSGELSRGVGSLLRTWLQCVLQNARPWMSDDIDRGALWFTEIASQLRDATVGIICLTQGNREAPWIMFEAGALAKGLEQSRICTLLIDLTPADVGGPLTQFNHARPDKNGLWQLAQTLNRALGEGGLKEQVLESVFETYWPRFEQPFKKLLRENPVQNRAHPRPSEDKLDELIYAVRALERSVSTAIAAAGKGPALAAKLKGVIDRQVAAIDEELLEQNQHENTAVGAVSHNLLEHDTEDEGSSPAFTAPAELIDLARRRREERARDVIRATAEDIEVDVPTSELSHPQ